MNKLSKEIRSGQPISWIEPEEIKAYKMKQELKSKSFLLKTFGISIVGGASALLFAGIELSVILFTAFVLVFYYSRLSGRGIEDKVIFYEDGILIHRTNFSAKIKYKDISGFRYSSSVVNDKKYDTLLFSTKAGKEHMVYFRDKKHIDTIKRLLAERA